MAGVGLYGSKNFFHFKAVKGDKDMIGITSYGAYIPRLRLERMAIFQSMGWFAPALMMVAQGERSMCNWDEDAITMAVAASRDCLCGRDKQKLDALYLASTTLPFADRQNAGIVSAALNLKHNLITADYASSQKASTTAMITALESVKSGDRNHIMVTATDRRETKAAYFYEMWFGDGAAALMVGDADVIAEYRGSYSVAHEFVDHYRGSGKKYDYIWEERWARDAGYSRIIPEVVNGLFEKLGITIADVDQLVYPCIFKRDHRNIAAQLGANSDKLVDNMHEVCGETGTAHPFVMFISALEKASPGDRILMIGFGQGANALLFEVTENITRLTERNGVAGSLANKKTIDNYLKWLKFRDLIQTEMGIRAEAPTQTATTVLWRKHKMILGLVGGKCKRCGTPQFPKMDVCVNPDCGAFHSQEDYEFADVPARIKTFTADMLSVSVDPPAIYGMVQFEGGGRLVADFTDCELDDLRVGLPVQMAFKRKGVDPERGFVNYFWKAVPLCTAIEGRGRIRFDDRVAIVTGAGAGLGRAYALELARRGARVVVNDLGGARDGSGKGSKSMADQVVEEIKHAGGEAAANYDNVATARGGQNIVRAALDAFGGVDILINNAGILRDKSFLKMARENWQAVLDVHLNGAYYVTRPAMAVMKEKGYGRIVMTTSAAGLYGNFGQSNYSAAKTALVGLMNTLKLEGLKYNIHVNTIAPIAASRLTEDVMPSDLLERSKPECVVPLVMVLCSEGCQESGSIFNCGMGYFNRAAVLTGPAVQLGDQNIPPTPELIHENWEKINSLDGAQEYKEANSAVFALFAPPDQEAAEDTPAAQEQGSVAAIFDNMLDTFKIDAAAGVDVVFQFNISGAGGGDWHCVIKDSTCAIEAGVHAQPACTLKMTDGDFLAMMEGALPAMQAYTSGKLKIEGDIIKSQLLEKLFSFGK
jgi:3-hydroxy-3-methylglutaryl CoA synthase/NAD(P)-dependent dehydrogenase (short-subunit alcohol dehydrogenase family)/putative sterol carrier protein